MKFLTAQLHWARLSPDDDDDAIKNVVRVVQVVEATKGSQLQDHLQGKHAGEDNVADLQNVSQLLRLIEESSGWVCQKNDWRSFIFS